jgi:sugar phosphate isomerase/epimerase
MSKPQIYASTWSLSPVMDPVEAARFVASNGFQGLELNCDPLNFWPGLVNEPTIRELAAIREGEGIGFTIHAHHTVNPATRLPEEREAYNDMVKRIMDVAVKLSSPMIGIHPGVINELYSLERHGIPFTNHRYDYERLAREGWLRSVETIQRWADLAATSGLTITVENEVHVRHTATPTAESLAAMVEVIERPNVKVNFDTGHAFIGGGLMAEFTALKSHIVQLHLDDNKGTVSDHLPLGAGKVDFSAIVPFLATVNGPMVIEIHAPERPIEATLESRDYLLSILVERSF